MPLVTEGAAGAVRIGGEGGLLRPIVGECQVVPNGENCRTPMFTVKIVQNTETKQILQQTPILGVICCT